MRLPSLPITTLAGLLMLTAVSPDPGPEERACLQSYEPYHETYVALRNEGPGERQQLLRDLAPLIRRYGSQRSRCAALLHDHKMVLLTLEERYPEAVAFSDSVLALGPLPNSTELRVRMLQNLSLGQYMVGHGVLSIQTLLRAAAEADGIPARPALRLLTDVVAVAAAANDAEAVTRYTAVGERIARDSLRADSSLYGGLGHLYVARGMYDLEQIDATRDTVLRGRLSTELLDRMDRTLALYEQGRSHVTTDDIDQDIIALALRAVALAGTGRRQEAHRQILDARRRTPHLHVDYVASAVQGFQGLTYRLTGDWEAALETAQAYASRADADGVASGRAEGWYQVGYAADRLGRDEMAVDAYRHSILWFEEDRNRSLLDWSLTAYNNAQKPYLALARVLVRQGNAAEAFLVIEQSRVRHMLDVRETLEAQAVLSAEQQAQINSLSARRADLRVRRQVAGLSFSQAAAIDADIVEVTLALADRTGEVAERTLPSLSAIQQTLARDGRVLVAPVLDEADGTAFVVTADTLVAVRLPIGVAGLRSELAQLGGPWRTDADGDAAIALAPLHRLYRALLAPLAPWLPDGAPLVVIPDNALVGLPFEMLVERPAASFDEAAFVVRSRPVSTEMAATLLVEPGAVRTGEPTYDLVAFGRSDYGATRSSQRGAPEPLADLPHVRDEVRRVGMHARHGITALNRDATEGRLDAVIGEARIVHLAAHAEADPAYPLYSRVYLWGDDQDGGGDGAVHMYELLDRPLRADLVVLSGCSTARGPAISGEGLLGLQHAVRAAGARSSLATLWPIDDEATVELMRTFYDGLSRGLRKDEALHQAQLAYLAVHSGIEASPFYWAALVLSGDVSPVPLRTPSAPLWPLALAAVAVAGLGLAWRLAARRRRA